MSAGIRSQLGPAMARLAIHTTTATNQANADQAGQNVVDLAKTAEHLSRQIDVISNLLLEWGRVIDAMAEENQAAEEQRLMNWTATGGAKPADAIENAREALINLQIRIDILRAPQQNGHPPPVNNVNNGNNGNGAQPAAPAQNHPHLPPLKMPEFDGNQAHWFSFWEAFSKGVEANEALTNAQKLTYLFGALKGAARSMLDGLPFIDDNYQVAVDLLKGRFGDSQRRKEELQMELLRLPKATNTAHSLRSLHEGVERICRQLTSLGVDMDTNSFLITAIREKLPPETRAYLADKMVAAEGGIWTPKQWREGLLKAVKVREIAQISQEQNTPKFSPQTSKNNGQQGKVFSPADRAFPGVQFKNSPAKRGSRKLCSLCKKGFHRPLDCKDYPTPQSRKQRLIELGRCFICGWTGHNSNECNNPNARCLNCQGRHHLLVCYKPINLVKNGVGANGPKNGANSQPLGNRTVRFQEPTPKLNVNIGNPAIVANPFLVNSLVGLPARPNAYLMMAAVQVLAPNRPNHRIFANVFWDSGAQPSLIVDSAIARINPEKLGNEPMSITGFGQKKSVNFQSPRYSVFLKRLDGGWEEFLLNRTAKITPSFGYLAEAPEELTTNLLEHNGGNLELNYGPPDILIGIREFWRFITDREEILPGLFRIETVFGPIFGGEFGDPVQPIYRPICSPLVCAAPEANVEQMWSLEAIGIFDKPEKVDDELAMNKFQNSIVRLDNGRYEVKWPWRDGDQKLSPNFGIAYSRLTSLVNRMKTNPKLGQRINEVFLDYIERGIIEPSIKRGEGEYFLPHHPVIQGDKLREVFDASSHEKGALSLNDVIYPGPNLVPLLPSILLKFRTTPVPVLADLEKAFLMISLAKEDRHFAKFLWLKDPSKASLFNNLAIYQFTRIAFGVAASPFILAATLKLHLENDGTPLAKEILEQIYVDNILLSADKPEEASRKAVEAQAIFANAQMRLCQFVAADPTALVGIDEKDRLTGKQQKVLGIQWHLENEELLFELPNPVSSGKGPTRRQILATVASFFDPLGLCSPLLVDAKLLFQDLWDCAKKWDDVIDGPNAQKWAEIVDDWKGKTISVHRFTPISSSNSQLHIFTDASPDAYAAAVYLRTETADGIYSNLIFSKSRIKPKKMAKGDLTIPKLELMGILIGIRASIFVQEALKIEPAHMVLWSDSQIALSWVGSSSPQPTFVANRLREIRKVRNVEFRYVRRVDNPSDKGTRQTSSSQFQQDRLWWEGPEWLKLPSQEWPQDYREIILPPEESPPPNLELAVSIVTPPAIFDASRFSSWTRFLCSIAFVLRFLHLKFLTSTRFKAKFPSIFQISTEGKWTPDDRILVRNFAIKTEQSRFWSDPPPGTFLDENGIFRLKTRLANSDQSYDFKNPIFLPRSPLTYLIMVDCHLKGGHTGPDATLAEFLGAHFCPKARRMAKSVVRSCNTCKRDRAIKFKLPHMPPWPESRVKIAKPFQSVGIDYLGPVIFRAHDGQSKAWILLITCLCTRAVHLEATQSLTAEEFLQCFRRFISRRGKPQEIRSDHGTQFVLAKATLENCPDMGIKWILIPQFAPWTGGFYERLVGSVKPAFRRSLGQKTLNWIQLQTFVCEVEAILNNRPITFVSDEKEGPLPLRPVDFLIPKAEITLPELGNVEEAFRLSPAEKLAHLWEKTNQALNKFWDRWSQDYLLNLRNRNSVDHRNPRITSPDKIEEGHIVLVEEPLFPRNFWPLGKVVRLHRTAGEIRSADIKMANGRIWGRPINKLVPLEVSPTKLLPKPQNTAPEPIHNLRPRNKAKAINWAPRHPLSTLITFLAIFSLFLPFCHPNELSTCKLNGLELNFPENVSRAEICCEGSCTIKLPPKGIFSLEMSQDLLVTGYSCTAKYQNSNDSILTEFNCPAIDICLLISCSICLESVMNPKCNPLLFGIVGGIFLTLFLSICGCFLLCCSVTRKIIKNCFFMCKLLRCLCPRRKLIRFRRRPRFQPREDWEEEEIYEEFIPKSRQNLYSPGSPLTTVGRILAVLAIISLPVVEAGVETISISAKVEECTNYEAYTACIFHQVSQFILPPAGQPVNLILKGPEMGPMAIFTFILGGLRTVCEPSTLAHLRSYKTEIFSVKRCPSSGSCDGDFCAKLNINQSVPELKEKEGFPGNNFCMEVPQRWLLEKGGPCGYLKDGCLFYRPHIVPLNERVYELFECTWELIIPVQLKLEIPGSDPIEEYVELSPGHTFHWKAGNLSITPASFAQPPVPIADGRFISDWHRTAIFPKDYTIDLHCEDATVPWGDLAAKALKCSLNPDVCTHCSAAPSTGEMRCHCKEMDLETVMEDPSRRIPLDVGQHKILWEKEEERLWAETSYTAILFSVKTEDVVPVVRHDHTKCEITPLDLTGCYKCRTGGKFTYTCSSQFGEPLAEIRCRDGTNFVTVCRPNGTRTHITLPFTEPIIKTTCEVECPGGITKFELNGNLAYVPTAKGRWGTQKFGSAGEISAEGWAWPNPFALHVWIFWILSPPQCLFALGGIIISIIAAILFVKLNPLFRTYRALAHALVIAIFVSIGPHFANAELELYEAVAAENRWEKLNGWEKFLIKIDQFSGSPLYWGLWLVTLAIFLIAVGMLFSTFWPKLRPYFMILSAVWKLKKYAKFSSYSEIEGGTYSQNCTVCFEPFSGSDKTILFQCKHSYHARCIWKWAILEQSCPDCRAHIDGSAAKV